MHFKWFSASMNFPVGIHSSLVQKSFNIYYIRGVCDRGVLGRGVHERGVHGTGVPERGVPEREVHGRGDVR